MSGKKILLVDDDKKVAESIGTFFRSLGHEVLIALDGQAALEIIQEQSPALVLLDMQLPRINGTAVLSILRSTFRATKVFVITAYSRELKSQCDAIGYDRFFEKPIELDPLLDAIEEVIEDKKKEEIAPLKGIPKARILFVVPNVIVSSYTSGLFHSKEFCKGDYTLKEINDYGKILTELHDYQPQVVIMYDYSQDSIALARLAAKSSFCPKVLIVHGLFPKPIVEVQELAKEGILYCNQNTMTDEELRKSNLKLIDLVSQECLKKGLTKK